MDHRQLKGAGFKELLFWFVGKRRRYRVSGWSMWPLLVPGDQVLLDYDLDHVASPGEVVIIEHPQRSGFQLIKRVEQVLADGALYVTGFNQAASTDSRSFGAVQSGQLIGQVRAILR